jgi:hypothetical protein
MVKRYYREPSKIRRSLVMEVEMAGYDKYGQIIGPGSGAQSGYVPGCRASSVLGRLLITFAIVGAVVFLLGPFGTELRSPSVQTDSIVAAPRQAEGAPVVPETRSGQTIRRGTRDIVVSVLHRNPDSRYPYRIHDGNRFVPVVLREGERLVGRRLRIWREFTGTGREFRILRYEVIG